jgi:hypothetical protein
MTSFNPDHIDALAEEIVGALEGAGPEMQRAASQELLRVCIRALMRFHTRDEARDFLQVELLDHGVAPKPAAQPRVRSYYIATACAGMAAGALWTWIVVAAARAFQ